MFIKQNEIDPEKFIELLREQDIIVYEDIQASKIWCNYTNGKWQIRPKSINESPLNFIDLAIQKYYNKVFAYLLSLSDTTINKIKSGCYFCFEYFPDDQPANIKYDHVPKNNLILTSIYLNDKYENNYDILKKIADILDVETLPLIYKGKLSEKQLLNITYFLHINKNDVDLFFKNTNFAEFFYNLLNPFIKNSYLKNNDFQDNLQKLIIRFVKSNEEYTLELLNPLYKKLNLKTNSEFGEVYSILLFNFMDWLLTVNLDDITINGNNREIIYINLMCKLFNMYINVYEKNILSFNFVIPHFFMQDKFKINQEFIVNKTTLDLINKNAKYEYIFKIILTNFRYEKKKTIGIINDVALYHLNQLIKNVQIKIEELFNYNSKINQYGFKTTLNSFPNIKYDTDSKGYVQQPTIDHYFDVDKEKEGKKDVKPNKK